MNIEFGKYYRTRGVDNVGTMDDWHAQVKAELESWIAAEKLKSCAHVSIMADRNPAAGRSDRS